MKSLFAFRLGTLAAALALAAPVQAQWLDSIKKALKPDAAAPAATTPATTPVEAAAGKGNAAKSTKDIDAELRADPQCNRPQERFNISEKLMDFGGTAAQARLTRLIETDAKYSDLTPEDKKMLRYVAQTTVWISPEVESKLGRLFDLGSKRPPLSDLDQISLDTLLSETEQLRSQTADFPSKISISVNPELPDGAFTKFGGRIEISPNILQLMSEHAQGADFVLSHEIAHVYKRHAVKLMQFQLIASSEGWGLGKQLLKRAMAGDNSTRVENGIYLFKTVPTLVLFVRNLKLKYNFDQELEADTCSARWLAGINKDAWAAWLQYRQHYAQHDDTPTAEGAQPTTHARDDNLGRLLPATASGRPRTPSQPASAAARRH